MVIASLVPKSHVLASAAGTAFTRTEPESIKIKRPPKAREQAADLARPPAKTRPELARKPEAHRPSGATSSESRITEAVKKPEEMSLAELVAEQTEALQHHIVISQSDQPRYLKQMALDALNAVTEQIQNRLKQGEALVNNGTVIGPKITLQAITNYSHVHENPFPEAIRDIATKNLRMVRG